MRLIVPFVIVVFVAAGCKRPGGASGGAGKTTRPPWAPQNAAGAAPLPTVGLPGPPPAARPRSAPLVDCQLLLSTERASALIGVPLVFTGKTPTARTECQWARGATDVEGGLIDVVVTCQQGAIRMYRGIRDRIAQGDREVRVGHKAVLIEGKTQSLVQFIDEKSACAAEVTVIPAGKALAVAQEISETLAGAAARLR